MDKTAATKAVAEMLSVHKQLEGIRIKESFDSSFDPAAWDILVTPRLECFPAILKIRLPSTRAAVLASALAHANNKPSPAFMLLRANVDILASYHDEVSNL
jgi:hypothetical protein